MVRHVSAAGWNRCRQIQPLSFPSRCNETEVNSEVVLTSWISVSGSNAYMSPGANERFSRRLQLGDTLDRPIVRSRYTHFVLVAPIEPYQSPGEMVVDGSTRPRWHHQAGKRKTAVAGAIEKPHADPVAHSAISFGFHEFLRQPIGILHQLSQVRFDPFDDGGDVGCAAPMSFTFSMNARILGESTYHSSRPVGEQ